MKNFLTIFLWATCLICWGQTITDIDGNIYNTVTVGTQTWTAENLKTTKYSNGDSILYEAMDSVWAGLTNPAFCTYNNDTTYRDEYGNLYNYYSITDSRSLCPSGWHIPSDSEWTTLINFLGGDTIAGSKMKKIGFGSDATNSSGLTVLPAGYRYSNNGFNHGGFNGLTHNGGIWSCTSTSDSTAIAKYFYPGSASVGVIDNKKSYGWSVRCVLNLPAGINENESLNDIIVYPNPFSHQLTFTLADNVPSTLSLYNFLGQQVLQRTFTNSTSINTEQFADGIYFYELRNNKGTLKTGKVVKQ